MKNKVSIWGLLNSHTCRTIFVDNSFRKIILVGFLVLAVVSSNAEIRVLSNDKADDYPEFLSLKDHPILTNPDSNKKAIYSDLVARYMERVEESQQAKELGLDVKAQGSKEEDRDVYFGRILYNSFISNGWIPVKKVENSNLIFHHREISCSSFGDPSDCIYNMSNANCESKYKAIARVSTSDGEVERFWTEEEGQSKFMAYNFSDFQDRKLGLCRYQFEAMEKLYKSMGAKKR